MVYNMKLQLFFIVSLYIPITTFSAFAISASCNPALREANQANNMVVMADFYYGPVKSIITTSTLPEQGRLKAFKGEARFDECGMLTKYSFSTQEYIHENIETNLLRMSSPDNIKYKYQLKNNHNIHEVYLDEKYHRNAQNQFTEKFSYYYDNDKFVGKDVSQYHYSDNKIASETIIESSADNKGAVTQFYYDAQGRMLKTVENENVILEFKYAEDNKVLRQRQIFTSLYDDIREYDNTCKEWDSYNNCLTWDLVTRVIKNDKVLDTSTATVYNKFEYY